MKKENGFTLVEIITVIVIIGLLALIIFPNIMDTTEGTKEEAYNQKINLIKQSAVDYGISNQYELKNSKSYCYLKPDADGNVSEVIFSTTKINNYYPCIQKSVGDLAAAGLLNYDYETDDGNSKIIINPNSKKSINNCKIIIYYRNNNVYAYYDRDYCIEEDINKEN